MVQLQILSRVLQTHDFSIIENNGLSEDYFPEYSDEFKYIQDHVTKYGNVPDVATFLSHFNNGDDSDIELVEVTESEKYLIDTLREEYTYHKMTPIWTKAAELMSSDSNAAVEYIVGQMNAIQPTIYTNSSSDIVSQASDRLAQYKERKEHAKDWFFTCGFQELDDVIHGIQRSEELLVIMARTNNLKSFVLEKMCAHVWQLGFNVGYFSPEMSPTSVGFRFDTLVGHFSNKGLMWGTNDIDEEKYAEYIKDLESKPNKFHITTPRDFENSLTVSKIRTWVKSNNLDLVAIDGITYITDERGKRNDSKTVSLTNISEDLMSLSCELEIPILVVVQANRNGVVGDDDGTPELESMRDSDGIAFNASKVLSIRYKKDGVLEIGVKKQRNGIVGASLNYACQIDIGMFEYIPKQTDEEVQRNADNVIKKAKKKKDNTDCF